jgi:hypothetical protein
VGRCVQKVFALIGLSLAAAPCSAALYPYQTFPIGSAASVVAIGDLNGDGRLDVAVATGSNGDAVNDRSVFVFLQTSQGTLSPPVRYSTGVDARGIAIGDLNGDGRADLAVCGDAGVVVLRQQPDGTLGAPAFIATGQDADGVAIGDLNGDGRADLAVSHSGEAQISVMYQTATGDLAPPRRYRVPGAGFDQIAIGDVTGDGLRDLVFLRGTSGRANLAVFRQDGATHQLIGPYLYGWGITRTAHSFALGDLSGDGRTDVAVTWGGDQPDCGLGIFRRGANDLLQAAIPVGCSDSPEPIAVADMNGDGLLDLVVAHGGWQSLGTLIQQPDGTYVTETLDPLPYASSYAPQSLAVGDLNGDGRPDVALVDGNNGLVILYNAGSVDLTPPSTTILTGPPQYSRGMTAFFQFIGLDDVTPASALQYRGSLDGGAWTAFSASTTATVTGLSEGWHTFSVAARDVAGIIDPNPPTYSFAIDRTPPQNLAIRGVSPYTAAQSITLSAAATDQIAPEGQLTYAWRVDGGPWSNFSAARALTLYGLFEGPHTVEVEAADPAGNTTESPAAIRFVVDRTPPHTGIDRASRNPDTGATTVEFSGTDNKPPPNRLMFSWRLDGGAWSPFSLSTQAMLSGLAPGPHTFEVRARDSAGNIDPTPAKQTL